MRLFSDAGNVTEQLASITAEDADYSGQQKPDDASEGYVKSGLANEQRKLVETSRSEIDSTKPPCHYRLHRVVPLTAHP